MRCLVTTRQRTLCPDNPRIGEAIRSPRGHRYTDQMYFALAVTLTHSYVYDESAVSNEDGEMILFEAAHNVERTRQ